MSDTGSDRETRLLPEEARLVRQVSTGGMPATSWDELAVRRLRYLSGVGLVVGVIGGALSFFRQPNVGALRGGLERPVILIPVWILASGLVLLAARSRLSHRLRLDIGLGYLVVVSILASLFRHWLPYAETDVLRGFSPVVVAILFFSAIVPVHPLRMAVAAAAAASTDALGLLATIWIQGNPVPKWNLWLWILVPDAVSVPLAVATSRFLYTVGRSLERAREMGSYRLIEKLGEGGMGEVWSARHRMLARPAAVKLIPRHRLAAAGDGEGAARLLRRFEREAQATASLQSPHTIEVYDFGVDETGAFFYVMELLDGLSLQALVEEAGPLPPGRAVRILLGMCHSLEDAHAHGLIHRDIKPSNVFLCRRGLDFDFVKVLDFGLVKQESDAASAEDTRLTKEGSFIGSPGYMAPEVFKGLAPTRSVDIYAFGCVAYWLLAGRQVFEAPTAMMLFYAHLNHRPDPLYYTPSESPRGSQISREHAPQAPAADQAAKRGRPPEAVDAGEDLPPLPSGQRGRGPSQTRLRAVPALCAPARANVPEALDRLVLRCLEKEPADRPASFEEIVKELESTGLAAQWTADDARAWWAERTPGGPTRE